MIAWINSLVLDCISSIASSIGDSTIYKQVYKMANKTFTLDTERKIKDQITH